MVDLIVTLVILAILAAAIVYIYRAKKSGAKCIGCPAAGKCPSHQGGGCTCHTAQDVTVPTEEASACSACASDSQTDA